jgi:hypothetical protein
MIRVVADLHRRPAMRRPDRPLVIDAPTDRRIFETCVETQLAPTLRPGEVVVLDNLPAHESAAAEQAVRAMPGSY